MADELDPYVDQRVPTQLIHDAAANGTCVEVHGVYPDHFDLVGEALGLQVLKSLTPSQIPGKAWNGVRPGVFETLDAYGSEVLCFAVPPGHDYVLHYASLVAHVLLRYTHDLDRHMRVWRYPLAEQDIAAWTGLDEEVTNGADTVVFGKVEILSDVLGPAGYECCGHRSTPHYDATTFCRPGARTVTVLGVRFSYWGSIGALLAQRCCALGVQEILYVGKLGTLRRPEDIYRRLYVPSEYGLLAGRTVHRLSCGPPNGLLARMPCLDSGLHISVPTVLEEDQSQRALARLLGATTVDNELAQMALGVHDWNMTQERSVSFSGLHYATDYLRGREDVDLDLPYSLARGRTVDARFKRRQAERLVGQCILTYLTDEARAVA